VEEEKNLGETLLAGPEFMLDLPITAVKGVTGFTVNEIILSKPASRFFELFKEVDRVWGFAPIVGYGSNSGLEGGLGFWSKGILTKGERFKLKGSYSTNHYQKYKLYYAAPNKLGAFRRVFVLADYGKRPRESFYGTGNKSNENDEVAFTLEKSVVQAGWHHQLHPTLKAGFQGSYRVFNIYDGDSPDRPNVLTRIEKLLDLEEYELRSSRFWSVGAELIHDWRNHPGQPTEGGVETFSLEYNHGLERTEDLEYLRVRFDSQHFLELYNKRLLALRVMAEITDRLSDSRRLPFYLRPALGGLDNLRGYRSRRFVDHAATLISLEYRYPIWQVVDAFIFFEEGRVFNAISEDFTFKDWHYSTGAGIRVWEDDGLIFAALFAVSDEGVRFYLQFDEVL
jgi:outer membrane protein assembly factor BamA